MPENRLFEFTSKMHRMLETVSKMQFLTFFLRKKTNLWLAILLQSLRHWIRFINLVLS